MAAVVGRARSCVVSHAWSCAVVCGHARSAVHGRPCVVGRAWSCVRGRACVVGNLWSFVVVGGLRAWSVICGRAWS